MSKAWMLGALLGVGLVMMFCCAGSANAADQSKFMAAMTGDQVVAPVTTKATGSATFTFNAGKTEMTYEISVLGLKDAVAAHIHMGEKGKEGDAIVNLFVGPEKSGPLNGVLATGTIKAADLVGSAKGKTISDIADWMANGSLYVNVHTRANPDGEVRGQIVPEK